MEIVSYRVDKVMLCMCVMKVVWPFENYKIENALFALFEKCKLIIIDFWMDSF